MTASDLTIASDVPMTSADPGTASSEPDRTKHEPVLAVADSTVNPEPDEISVPPCPRLPLALLAPHPDNKREDLDLNEEFVASIREDGIRDPIEIVPLITGPARTTDSDDTDDDGPRPLFTIIDGHRRYFGALMAEAQDAPVYLAADRDGDTAGQYLDMFTSSRHTTRLRPIEEANALFAAHQAGATQAVIRRKTGLGRDEVRAALKAGGLGTDTRLKAGDYDLTIDQYALLREFEDDGEEILADIGAGRSGQHSAERIRERRAAKAAADKAREQFAADGYQVSGELPEGARYVRMLLHDGEDLTPEAHASCPGRGVVIRDYDPDGDPFCADPGAHGHVYRYAPPAVGSGATADTEGTAGSGPAPEPDGPSRRLVMDGNRAWTAAGKVRHGFLKSLCGRATVARDAEVFASRQLLAMPAAVAGKLSGARHCDLFRDLTGGAAPGSLAAWKPGRLPLISLALVLTCYEQLLTSDAGKATWRETSEHKFPPVRRDDAGAYFTALAALGYELSAIEQALADGVPCTGEPALTPHPAAAGNAAPGGTGNDPAPADDTA